MSARAHTHTHTHTRAFPPPPPPPGTNVDYAATWLAMAGVTAPSTYDGRSILTQLVPAENEDLLPEPTRYQIQLDRAALVSKPWRTEQFHQYVNPKNASSASADHNIAVSKPFLSCFRILSNSRACNECGLSLMSIITVCFSSSLKSHIFPNRNLHTHTHHHLHPPPDTDTSTVTFTLTVTLPLTQIPQPLHSHSPSHFP
jgi:hypothetical protein